MVSTLVMTTLALAMSAAHTAPDAPVTGEALAPAQVAFNPAHVVPAENCLDWKKTTDTKSGRAYYYHRVTKKTAWKLPDECGGEVAAGCADWKSTTDTKSGRSYYYNKVTKKTAWELPTECKGFQATSKNIAELAREEAKRAIAEREEEICGGWKVAKDANSGKNYYYNAETRETSWELPDNCPGLAVREEENTAAKKAGSGPCSDWKPAKDASSGKTYYYNVKSKQTKWAMPDDCT